MEEGPSSQSSNRNYIIFGIIVIIAIIFFAVQQRNSNNDNVSDEQQSTEQAQEENSDNQTEPENTEEVMTDDQKMEDKNQTPQQNNNTDNIGNISIAGTLKTSDDLAKGNLVVESDKGKIYLFTSRDFSSLLEKSVTLSADGSLERFTLLDIRSSDQVTTEPEQNNTRTENSEAHNAEDGSSTVEVSGTLTDSDNQSRGNYIIDSNQGKIYLLTKHDYNAWIGSQVTLSAIGTIHQFHHAVLTKN